MKCNVICYDYMHQNGGPWTTVCTNVQALVTFSWHTASVLIGEKHFICSTAVKLNVQSEMFAHVLAMGCYWGCTHKYTFVHVQ